MLNTEVMFGLIPSCLDWGHGGPRVVPTGPVERVQGQGKVGM